MLLLIDNYDSFTYNLYEYFRQLNVECRVVRNDALTVQEVEQLRPAGIVISPGPKVPAEAGITLPVIRQYYGKVPILGICLGFQALGVFKGAPLEKSEHPVHGKTAVIEHNSDPVFKDLPATFQIMRYHSLLLSNLDATPLRVIAKTKADHIPMAICDQKNQAYGFQFHPESILTEYGRQLLANWMQLSGVGKR